MKNNIEYKNDLNETTPYQELLQDANFFLKVEEILSKN